MADRPRWYPPGQVCTPPELPAYLKNVYDLKPIIGIPNDDEVIGIHTVMQVARKALEIPGMHGPGLLMDLADHLFSAQMGKYLLSHDYSPNLDLLDSKVSKQVFGHNIRVCGYLCSNATMHAEPCDL
ncbi:hypothetical protein FRC11_000707 [Ceratobasidium sp. 423]|nr:hypothetical protein FRC11_000707 [Ceratobasidium sp. 423]